MVMKKEGPNRCPSFPLFFFSVSLKFQIEKFVVPRQSHKQQRRRKKGPRRPHTPGPRVFASEEGHKGERRNLLERSRNRSTSNFRAKKNKRAGVSFFYSCTCAAHGRKRKKGRKGRRREGGRKGRVCCVSFQQRMKTLPTISNAGFNPHRNFVPRKMDCKNSLHDKSMRFVVDPLSSLKAVSATTDTPAGHQPGFTSKHTSCSGQAFKRLVES
jgi:hypothetical protein